MLRTMSQYFSPILVMYTMACSKPALKTKTEPPKVAPKAEVLSDTQQSKIEKGPTRTTRLVYEITAPEELQDAFLHLAHNALARRLAFYGEKRVSLLPYPRTLVIEIDASPSLTTQIQREVEAPFDRLSFALVDEDSELMKKVHAYVSKDVEAKGLGIKAQMDTRRHDGTGRTYFDYYLSAEDSDLSGRKRLVQYIDGLAERGYKAAQDRVFGFESWQASAAVSWRTYYLSRQPSLQGSFVAEAEIEWNPQSNRPEVLVTFTSEGKAAFAELTAKNIGKKVAILAGGRVVSAATVGEAITGGSMSITMGGYDSQAMRHGAQDLVADIRLGIESFSLRLKSKSLLEPGSR